VADVQIISDRPVPEPTVPKAAPDATGVRRVRTESAALPSRAADNLYWLGRYIVRFEEAARLLRAYHLRLAVTDRTDDALLTLIAKALKAVDISVDAPIPAGLRDRLFAAHGCASKIRDRFSPDGWDALNDLVKTTRQMVDTATPGDDAARAMSVLLRKTAGFSGIVTENIYRFYGWRFLSIGRALERTDSLAAALQHFAPEDAPEGALEVALAVADGTMSHRRRYALEPTRDSVVDLLAHDTGNPRSLLFQIREMQRLAEDLPGATLSARPTALVRELLPVRTQLEILSPEALTTAVLGDIRTAVARMSDRLAEAHLR
jgi:uncharacterized alpha-E superfamily protein